MSVIEEIKAIERESILPRIFKARRIIDLYERLPFLRDSFISVPAWSVPITIEHQVHTPYNTVLGPIVAPGNCGYDDYSESVYIIPPLRGPDLAFLPRRYRTDVRPFPQKPFPWFEIKTRVISLETEETDLTDYNKFRFSITQYRRAFSGDWRAVGRITYKVMEINMIYKASDFVNYHLIIDNIRLPTCEFTYDVSAYRDLSRAYCCGIAVEEEGNIIMGGITVIALATVVRPRIDVVIEYGGEEYEIEYVVNTVSDPAMEEREVLIKPQYVFL